MKNKIIFFLIFFFTTTTYANNKEFYENRYKFIEEYIAELKKLQKKNSSYRGAVAESLQGSFFSVFDKKNQSTIDQKAIEICQKNNKKKCKVRFQSLKINPNYNRFATYDPTKKILDAGLYEVPSLVIEKHKGIIFLKSSSNYFYKDIGCTTNQLDHNFVVDIIRSQINLFPSSFLNQSGLKFVMICDKIQYGPSKLEGPEGMAPSHYDQSPGVFFLSLEKIKKQVNSGRVDIIKHVFHHEFYHIIDSALTKAVLDEEWVKINKFPYSKKKLKAQFSELLNDKKGFISKYAMNNEFEDKAELFAYLITRNKEMKKYLAKDPILFDKAKLMILRMKKLSPDINSSFWSKL
ncbi:putative zinc-binding metallopeptidase [Pelagibacteraceae bacterium]|jgi:hypothetical protein|nr:putative zinc-binding metallopeptidase [Pelagibacteraceae bacterium]